MKKIIPHLYKRHTKLVKRHDKIQKEYEKISNEYCILEEELTEFFNLKWKESFGDIDVLFGVYINSSYFENFEPRIILSYIGNAMLVNSEWSGEDPGCTVQEVHDFAAAFQEACGISTILEPGIPRTAAEVLATSVYEISDLYILYPNLTEPVLCGDVQYKGISVRDLFFIFKMKGKFHILYHKEYDISVITPGSFKQLDEFLTFIETDSNNTGARACLEQLIIDNWKAKSVPAKLNSK
jgi:hypothetical protein